MTPRHLVTTDPSTAPQPPAEMCHHPRDQCDQVTSGRVSRVTCHVAGTLSPHCHQGPGARCDYITSGESRGESHSPHHSHASHGSHSCCWSHYSHTLSHWWSHSPAGYITVARSCGVAGRGKTELQCRVAGLGAAAVYTPARTLGRGAARQLEPGSSNNHFITSDYPQPAPTPSPSPAHPSLPWPHEYRSSGEGWPGPPSS